MDISDLFPAGPVLDEEHQVGRIDSIEGLAERLRAGDVVRIFDRRRWGKSSVARAALQRLRTEGLITARVALDEYPTPAAAAAVLTEAFVAPPQRAEAAARSVGSRIGEVLSRGGKLTGSEDASVLGGLLEGLRPEEVSLQRVLSSIPEVLTRHDRHAAIVIDEAHVIASWESEVRGALRAFLADGGRRAGVALASSDGRAERKLRRSSVLGYLGEEFTIALIATPDWIHSLRLKFEAAGVPIDADALALLLEESRGHPYCTMLLAKQTAQLALPFGAVSKSVVQLALPTVEKHDAWRKLR